MEQSVTDKLRRLTETAKRLRAMRDKLSEGQITRGEKKALSQNIVLTEKSVREQADRINRLVSKCYTLVRFKKEGSDLTWESSFVNCDPTEAQALAELYAGSRIQIISVSTVRANPNPKLSDEKTRL